ncbi:MAG: Uma2 family endonuclease [Chthonomonadaceae bacterium]|nr:Uma2 family endonuclease [Chthonomonadaceae bacterium]
MRTQEGAVAFTTPTSRCAFPTAPTNGPDIAIFCERPEQNDEAVTALPDAVIEVISKGYRARDYVIGLPFYLTQGIKDIVVFNPYTNEVLHCRPSGYRKTHESPVELTLIRGCTVTV